MGVMKNHINLLFHCPSFEARVIPELYICDLCFSELTTSILLSRKQQIGHKLYLNTYALGHNSNANQILRKQSGPFHNCTQLK